MRLMPTSGANPTDWPSAAVVVPCRNEALFIRRVVASILESPYPRDRLEVVFVDGMSTDGTREILGEAARAHAFLRVLDNPRFTAPAAMNIGIRATKGEVIVRLDAHAEYPRDYIPCCVRLLISAPGVGSAGGRSVPVPNGEGPWARAVAFVTAHRFGVGNAAYKTSSRPGNVDTVALGTFRRAVLEEVGLYDERLTRNQDNELHARLQKAGYSIVYDPAIALSYLNQRSPLGLARQGLRTSVWNVYTLVLHPYTWQWRRFVPTGFVAYMAVLAAAAWRGTPWLLAAALPACAYALFAAVFSLRGGKAAGGALRVAATFISYHVAYGAGTFIGLANVLSGRWRAQLGRPFRGVT